MRCKELIFGAVVGSQSFVDWARGLLSEKGEDRKVSQLSRARLRPSVEAVCEVVADAHGIAVPLLIRKGLKRNESRDVAAYLARVHRGHKLAELGDHFGGISGAAVSHACRQVEAKLQNNRGFRKKVAGLRSEIRSSDT